MRIAPIIEAIVFLVQLTLELQFFARLTALLKGSPQFGGILLVKEGVWHLPLLLLGMLLLLHSNASYTFV